MYVSTSTCVGVSRLVSVSVSTPLPCVRALLLSVVAPLIVSVSRCPYLSLCPCPHLGLCPCAAEYRRYWSIRQSWVPLCLSAVGPAAARHLAAEHQPITPAGISARCDRRGPRISPPIASHSARPPLAESAGEIEQLPLWGRPDVARTEIVHRG